MKLIFTCWFCLLQLYWIFLIVLGVISIFFCIKYHAICNRNNFISSFLIWLLFYFSCLIAGAITSKTMLNTNPSHMQVPPLHPGRRALDCLLRFSECDINCRFVLYSHYFALIYDFYYNYIKIFVMKTKNDQKNIQVICLRWYLSYISLMQYSIHIDLCYQIILVPWW